MNRNIRRLREQIERRGGKVHLDKNIPDEIAELFLKEVLACPDCVEPSLVASNSVTRMSDGSGH
jgi:hypothetical protein